MSIRSRRNSAVLATVLIGAAASLGAEPSSCFGPGAPADVGWRWYHNDADQLPTPRTEPMDMLWGARGGDLARLRSTRPMTPSTDAWRLGDGAGTRGAPLEHQLLENVFERGVFREAGAGSYTPYVSGESDGAFSLIPQGSQPGHRTRFGDADIYTAVPQACAALVQPTMTEPTALTSSGGNATRALGVVVDDWDRDGHPDILVSARGRVLWFRNDGAGRFYPGAPITGSGAPPAELLTDDVTVAVADWTRDGLRDLILATVQGAVWVMENQGATNPPVLAHAARVQVDGDFGDDPFVSMSVLDWDSNGTLDLVLGTRVDQGMGSVLLALSAGGGQFTVSPMHAGLACAGACLTTVTDWNGDGLSDLLVGSAGGDDTDELRWLRNVGSALVPALDSPQPIETVGTLRSGGSPAFGDVTGDGLPDLLVIDSSQDVLVMPNTGSLTAPLLGVRRGLPGAAIFLGPDPVIAMVSWAPFGLPEGFRRQLLVGDADGRLSLWRDANSEGPPVFASSEPIFDEAKIPIGAPSRACPTMLYPPGAERAVLAVGGGGYIFLYQLTDGPDANVESLGPLTTVAPGNAGAVPVPLQQAGACPQASYWDDDGFMDLVMTIEGGQIMLLRGTDTNTVFSGPELLMDLGTREPARMARGVDWNDDGHVDLIYADEGGHIYWYAGLPTGALEQVPTLLLAGEDKLVFEQGAALAGFDVDGEDCAKDLIVAAGTGELFTTRGHVAILGAPHIRYPTGATELDELGDKFHGGDVRLRWLLGDDSLTHHGTLRIEMSDDRDFFPPVDTRLVSSNGPASNLADSMGDIPRLAPGGRLHWRLRFEGDGIVGQWSPTGSVAVPRPGRNPVDAEPSSLIDGKPRLSSSTLNTNFENMKVVEGPDAELADKEIYTLVSEALDEDDKCGMRIEYVLNTLPFENPRHLRLAISGMGEEGEIFDVSAWQGDSWRRITGLPEEGYASLEADLLPEEFATGAVHVLIASRAISPECDTISLDGLYLFDTNTPPHAVATATPEGSVETGQQVLLDGTASLDADGDIISYLWTQQTGPTVEISPDNTSPVITFVTPPAANGQPVGFALTVSDQQYTDTAIAGVVINNPVAQTVRFSPGVPRGTIFANGGALNLSALTFATALEPGTAVEIKKLRVRIQGDPHAIAAARLLRYDADGESEHIATANLDGSHLSFDSMSAIVGGDSSTSFEIIVDVVEAEAADAGAAQGTSMAIFLLLWALWPVMRRQRLLGGLLCALAASSCVSGTPNSAPTDRFSLRIEDPAAVQAFDTAEGLPARIVGTPVVGAPIEVRYQFDNQ